jgi:hypothetical protein
MAALRIIAFKPLNRKRIVSEQVPSFSLLQPMRDSFLRDCRTLSRTANFKASIGRTAFETGFDFGNPYSILCRRRKTEKGRSPGNFAVGQKCDNKIAARFYERAAAPLERCAIL